MPVQTTYSNAPAAAYAGLLVGGTDHRITTGINKESAASTPFGFAVVYDGSTENGVLNPDATTDKVRGLVVHSHAYSQTELGVGTAGAGTAVKGPLPGAHIDICEAGEMWVICESGCVAGDPLFIRAVATGAEVEGALRNAADSTDCIDCSDTGKWTSNAAAGALAKVKFDFTGAA